MRTLAWGAAAPIVLALAGCAAKPTAAPHPLVNAPAPPTLVVPPAAADWRDVPLTPGTWTYRSDPPDSAASFGREGAPVLLVRCLGTARQVAIVRPGAAGGTMTIRTSSSSRTVPLRATDGGAEAEFAARDPFLDEIAFSRGRFSVAGAGLPTLFLPSWAEPSRVIEDCRG